VNKIVIAISLGFFVLVCDQVLKIWVKTTMFHGEWIRITDWFYIHFVENPGMAFGIELGGDEGKIILTLLRILIAVFILYYAIKSAGEGASTLFLISMTLILAGALGNIIDSVFYGVLFTESTPSRVASFNPGNGYAPLFMGKVVDMFYFPIIRTKLPEWIPFVGGSDFVFFQPVFNIADASITVGVFLLILINLFKKRQ